MTDITSRECRSYLREGGDLAVIPVGSAERAGPHLPVGERGIVAETIADIFAEKYNGMRLPLIPYATVYTANGLRGSVLIEPALMHRYFTDLCDELYKNDFKRILFISFQDELYYLSQEYFQHHNKAPAWTTPDNFFNMPNTVAASLDNSGRELWRLAACLRLRGDERLLRRVFEKTREYFKAVRPVCNKMRETLSLFGNNGYKLQENEWRFYPVNLGESWDENAEYTIPCDALVDKAAAELNMWVDSLADALTGLSTYQEYLNSYVMKRPI